MTKNHRIPLLRTLDIMYNHYDEYISHLYDASTKIVKRDTSVCFYNCSNYYFETESNDDDYVDAVTGQVTKGLRKYGVSKEHRPNPIAQMGLFMDNLEDVCYMSTYNNSQVLTALNAIMDLGLDKKYYQPKDLNKKNSTQTFHTTFFAKKKKVAQALYIQGFSHFSTIQLLTVG